MKPPAKPRVSVLMYHQVGPFERPSSHAGLYCRIDAFRSHMSCLERWGYQVISLDEAYEGLFLGKSMPPRPVVLTFDDGYQNFYEHALPILQAYGYPATVFAIAGKLGQRADWISGACQAAELMSDATLRELAHSRVTVGSHGYEHVRLSPLSGAALQRELVDSKRRLEDLLGQAVTHFCYPYGNLSVNIRDAVRMAGYRTGLTCERGDANAAVNPWEIPRKKIHYRTGPMKLLLKLQLQRIKLPRDNEAA